MAWAAKREGEMCTECVEQGTLNKLEGIPPLGKTLV